MLKKMQRRFVIAAMIAFATVMLVLTAGINILNYYQMTVSQDRTLSGILDYDNMTLSQPGEELPPINEMPWAGGPDSEFTTRFFVVHCDREGKINIFGREYISSIDEETAEAYAGAALTQGAGKGYYHDYRFMVKEGDRELIIAFLNVSDALQFRQTLLIVSLLITAVSLAVVFILVLLLSRSAIRPYMKNMERQKRFITDAGHELKTPITSIATSADIIAMEHENDEWVANIRKQTVRLTKLVNNLVMLSRMDEELPLPEKTTFSFSDTAWEIAEPFAAQAKAGGKQYFQEIEEQIMLHGDRHSISQMLSILLDNAVKYSDSGGEIRFCVRKSRGKVVIEIFNTCNLQNVEDPDRLFDRFYRPDESRSAYTGGSGIGLSIARAVAEAHGGKITVSTSDRRSILFKVVL